ncbi:AAA family ATPase [Aeromonas hydrophila]|uniref:AAA family ATPase n=1 Tax=Aeromonas hydrophila TaxID=644 RepID=UPI0028925EB9|nr:ATP-binding protein [Aeromonas hydrophila]
MKIFSKEKPKSRSEKYLFLSRSNWDDYSYKSTFQLYFFNGIYERHIGETKIIDSGLDIGYVDAGDNIYKLDDNLCSLGQTTEYYANIKKLDADGIEILKALNDCAYDEVVYGLFKELDQFKSSAVRFSTAEQALKFGRDIFSREIDTNIPPCHSFKFCTKLRGFNKKHNLDFKFFNQKDSKIPSNINVIIGRNGTGKTQLLSDLAKTISGYGFDNKKDLILSRDNKFGDSNPAFGHVMVISYSAFDSFEIPGRDAQEKEEMITSGHIHGYRYCGLRVRTDNNTYRLKDLSEINEEFTNTYNKILSSGKLEKWNKCIKHVFNDSSFKNVERDIIQTDFKKLSSGQKIILSILSGVYEHIKDNSIVILDEPETHLHPSLISAFMHSLRDILISFNSYAIIATHSPVILQETPSKFVQVLGGDFNTPRVTSLKSESFGEEISTLTEDVFHVSYEDSNFYQVLTKLAKDGYSANQIDRLFGKRLGFTARSFIESL